MTVVELRAAAAEDVATLAVLDAEAMGTDAWSAVAVAEELSGAGRRVVVAAEGGRPVGYAVTRTVGGVTDLQRVVVAPDSRRRGLGARLVAELLDAARRDGSVRVLLEVSARNEPARALYTRLGFVPVDRRAAYYRDGSDALVMQLTMAEEEEHDEA